ncbi:MAG: Ornithine/acetylornithine aminotransferase [Bacteroidetes bacterium HLUCCA01]|nr:MAG: Ornithine/acetylornithine aminotransferase [Bacteroidetes bacterium HLUCCA01]
MTNPREAFFNHIAQTSDSPLGLEIARAEGPYLYTTDGRRYTDFISGIAVSTLGHSHPEVIEAIEQQVRLHMHVMVYGEFVQKPQSNLAQLLASHLPDNLQRIYFVNSGTEANEGALKLAKKATGRKRMVAFRNSYHGDTHGALSVTGRDVYRDPYLPLLPDVTFLNFNDYAQLSTIDETVACVIMEPIQGEGGIIQADPQWLAQVRQQCTRAGALLIFDEIQSGMGRTGALFAFMHYGIVPDILCMAKALGGGMPIGAFASSHAIFEAFMYNPPLNHVTTFGGHPVSAAAAHAALTVLLRDKLMDRAFRIENRVRSVLKSDHITEIRGKGAMLGLQLKTFAQTRAVVEACLEQGILLGWTLHSNTLVRLAPPLTIPEETLTETLAVLLQAIHDHPPV